MLKGKQKKLDKNNNGRIDGEDFKLLRADKPMKAAMGKSVRGYGAARTSGTGLMDEQMAPGKVMGAKKGHFSESNVFKHTRIGKPIKKDPTKPISSVKPLGPLGGAKSMKISEAHKRVLGKLSTNKLKQMVKEGKNPDLKGDPKIKSSTKSSMEAKSFLKRKKYSSMEEMRKAKGFRPGESAESFNKRRLKLAGAKKALGATRLGKIAAGVALAGIGAKKYLESRMNKKMGGGMMKKYSVGGGADMGIKKDEDKITKRVKVYALAQKNKDHDRLTERDIAQAKKIASKKMGGGMMNKPMGYKSGTMVMARGCKLGRKKATKIT